MAYRREIITLTSMHSGSLSFFTNLICVLWIYPAGEFPCCFVVHLISKLTSLFQEYHQRHSVWIQIRPNFGSGSKRFAKVTSKRSSSDKVYIFPSWHNYKHQIFKFSSKNCIVSNKIRFKASHHLQYRENMHFLLQPLILRLYTGCPLDHTLRLCIASFKKVKVLKC